MANKIKEFRLKGKAIWVNEFSMVISAYTKKEAMEKLQSIMNKMTIPPDKIQVKNENITKH